tara:strand:- start:1369 stop:1989 length:621 start_codon:yes stop_codon:yes gene_type:complete
MELKKVIKITNKKKEIIFPTREETGLNFFFLKKIESNNPNQDEIDCEIECSMMLKKDGKEIKVNGINNGFVYEISKDEINELKPGYYLFLGGIIKHWLIINEDGSKYIDFNEEDNDYNNIKIFELIRNGVLKVIFENNKKLLIKNKVKLNRKYRLCHFCGKDNSKFMIFTSQEKLDQENVEYVNNLIKKDLSIYFCKHHKKRILNI